MASVLPTASDWINCGLVPTAGMSVWNMYDESASTNSLIKDYSGNGRDLTTAGGNPPTLNMNVLNGQPGWHFDGTNDFLNFTGSTPFKHLFILARAEEATFGTFRGLVTGATTTLLVGDNGTTKFFDNSGSITVSYYKTAAAFAQNNQQAPMSNTSALMELRAAGGITLTAVQVGQQTTFTTRLWKGYFYEMLMYNANLTSTDIARIYLYFNLKFGLFKTGLPFYFPSDDLMQFKRSRFYAQPIDYAKTTDNFEFQDGSMTFNEVAAAGPRHWEYEYLGRTPQEVIIFDAFWNQARLANVFNFTDKYGNVWPNVRIEAYNRSHDAHKSWSNDIKFKLCKYPGA